MKHVWLSCLCFGAASVCLGFVADRVCRPMAWGGYLPCPPPSAVDMRCSACESIPSRRPRAQRERHGCRRLRAAPPAQLPHRWAGHFLGACFLGACRCDELVWVCSLPTVAVVFARRLHHQMCKMVAPRWRPPCSPPQRRTWSSGVRWPAPRRPAACLPRWSCWPATRRASWSSEQHLDLHCRVGSVLTFFCTLLIALRDVSTRVLKRTCCACACLPAGSAAAMRRVAPPAAAGAGAMAGWRRSSPSGG